MILLIVEKGIRGGICHSMYWNRKANNKYLNVFDKNKKSSYIKYWDVNNLYGQKMLQKLPVNNFEIIKYTPQFNEDYSEESDEGYFVEVYVQYLQKLQELQNNLPFLRERMNIKSEWTMNLEVCIQYLQTLHELQNNFRFLPETMNIKKVEKLLANLHSKTEYLIHIRNLKQALNDGLVFG